ADTGGDAKQPSDAGSDAPITLACNDYCTTLMATCSGANAQFPDTASCVAACNALPPGTTSDTSGNTIGCREHVLATSNDPAATCASAGPTGGGRGPADAGAGVCGVGCESFCDIAMTLCTGTNLQFANSDVCMSACSDDVASLKNPPFSIADTTTNDFGC